MIADASIEGLEVVAIGGGARGVNVHLAPADLVAATGAQVVDITIPDAPEAPTTEAGRRPSRPTAAPAVAPGGGRGPRPVAAIPATIGRMPETPAPGPLAGIRVADCSTVLAGPYCTMLLADLGADVVKVEPPEGDATRGWGPPWVGDEAAGTRTAAYYLAVNRNKRSIRLDLKRTPGARSCAGCSRDVGRARGELPRRRAGAAGLRRRRRCDALNPDLVHLAISGFGTDGPDAQKPGYDFIVQAAGGLMSITGAPDDDGGRPTKVGVAISDVVTGLFGAVSRAGGPRLGRGAGPDRTGRGQRIDVSLLESTLAVLVNQAQNAFVSGRAPGRLGNAHPNLVPYETFRTADGEIAVGRGQRAPVAAPVRGPRAPGARRGPALRHQRRPRGPPRRAAPHPGRAVPRPAHGRVARGSRRRGDPRRRRSTTSRRRSRPRRPGRAA